MSALTPNQLAILAKIPTLHWDHWSYVGSDLAKLVELGLLRSREAPQGAEFVRTAAGESLLSTLTSSDALAPNLTPSHTY